MSEAIDRAPVTLEEVARAAGVSRSTVSRVINDLPGVSKRAREAVAEAITSLRYVPNQAARNLVTRRTDSIAVVVSEKGDQVFGDPFFAGVLRGVSAGLGTSHKQLVLLMSQGDADRDTLENYLCSGHVDGAIVVSLHGNDLLPRRLVDAGLPVVLVGRPLAGGSVPYVDSDNLTGGLVAARHLLSLGRSRIGTIAGPDDMAVGIDRLIGWRRALGDAKRPTDAVVHSRFSIDAGARAMEELLERHPDVDAVFAAADIIAVGAMQFLQSRGVRVPEDIAIVGFDDSVLATMASPPLTTVRQPVEELGRTTTWRLLAQLAGERHLPPSILLPTELILRSSA
ncbi:MULTISPECIES: LacI family DNA-binding transcriptional regulator [Actinokineospora]|uniref:LacI family transcriptional regulator n=1 Tax=Actinokineospora fastidiosa TaxID=1816 RepID=A0A918GNH4_9PSEU|nr:MULTISPECIES: LacI family DNA-binding transcriptional regulator [Actinokineospora]UVS78124.1 Degradation activator [Actinokineospora sp. UTMC 2448]GGS49495.1 LacI family transcriptional regulator [Actinokineospora fastidiosa]